jgi:uncharacterized protein DUF6461
MIATAADYRWFEERPEGLAEAYCLTLVRGLTATEFLARLFARPERQRVGVAALFEPSMMLWNEYPDGGLLIGVTTVSSAGIDWTIGVEVNGFLGVTEDLIVPLSAGTRLVSHSRNIELVDRFYWVEDQDIQLYFEPRSSCYREGSTPDALVDVMTQVGFDLREDGEDEQPTEAALALGEYLTDVRITPELLEQATYTCGIVTVPT